MVFHVRMFSRFVSRCWLTVSVVLCTATPLWAAEEEGPPEWVLSYAVLMAFLALTLMILLRPTKRSDSAFSFDELQAQKEEEMKKLKNTR